MPDTAPRPAARSAAALAPTPTAPVGGAVVPLDAATFRWTAPPGATAFDLRIAAQSDPETPLVELDGLPSTEATLGDALPAGPCLWWVRRAGGAWGAPARFVAGTPADVEVALREEAAAAGAAVEARRRERREAALRGPGLEAPPEPVWPYAEGPALEGAPALDWSAVPGFGRPAWGAAASTEAEPPHPRSPLGGEVADAAAVALRWDGVPGATAYEVQLSPHAAFDRDVLELDAGASTEVALPGVVPATGHRLLWRVRARTASGATRWSPYGRFYPAVGAAVDRYREGLDAALLAQRKKAAYDRAVRERELDLVPHWERADATTSRATFLVLIGMMLSSIALVLLTAAFSLLRF